MPVPKVGWCCELAVHVVETCWCWCRVPVLVLGWCWVPGAGAGGCWCCAGAGAGCRVPVLAVLVLGAGCRCWPGACAGDGAVSGPRGGDRLLVPVLVLGAGAGAVKGCTVCAHTFVRTLFYAQRQALNRPLFQHVSACYTQNSRAGYCLALGE